MLCLPNFRKHRKTTKREKKKDRDRWPDTFSKRIDCESVSFSYHVGVCPWRTFPWAETKKGKNGLFLASLCSRYSEMLPQICSAFLTSGPYTCYYLCLPGRSFLPITVFRCLVPALILMMTGLLLGSLPSRCTQIWFKWA